MRYSRDGPTKQRRHHNNKGYRQIKRGRTREQVREIARRLNIPYQFDAQPALMQIERMQRDERFAWALDALGILERGIVNQGYVTGAQLKILDDFEDTQLMVEKTYDTLLDTQAS